MLDLGGEVPRSEPISNPTLSDRQRRFEGEYCVFIQCAWRIELDDEVVCGSGDDTSPGGPMATAARMMLNRRVVQVDVSGPAFDLTLGFDGGLVLKLFCDQTNVEANDLNYSMTVGRTTASIGPRGRLDVERELTN